MSDVQVICNAQLSHCRCGLEPGHDGPHECVDPDPQCGGSWADHEDPDKVWVVRYPGLRPGGINEGLDTDPIEWLMEYRPRPTSIIATRDLQFNVRRGGVMFPPFFGELES